MKEDKFEQLVRNHPDIFQKSGDFEFSIEDGWFNIIDILLNKISYDLVMAKYRLKYALENPNAKMKETIPELEETIATRLEELPTITQVKEKFGGLRFYVDGGTQEMHHYIEFAEAMSYRTCEECGSPGKSRNSGWIKVLCDRHYREVEQKSELGLYPRGKSEVKLSDE